MRTVSGIEEALGLLTDALPSPLTDVLPSLRPPRVLDAGCGSAAHLPLPDDAWIVGVDISPDQLGRNARVNEPIVGDVQAIDLSATDADLAMCWDVLEHLDDPARAVANIASAVRPAGVVVFAAPDPGSIKGIVTKYTPHAFHVWVYRHLFGRHDAGSEGRGPFPTPMRRAMRPSAVMRQLESQGFDILVAVRYEGYHQQRLRSRFRLAAPIVAVFDHAVRIVTVGSLSLTATEYVIAARRRTASDAAPSPA